MRLRIIFSILVITLLVANDPRGRQRAEDPIRISTALVTIPTVVTDPIDRYVTGLTKDNFEIYENNIRQEIKHFGTEDGPVSIGVIFDTSGSMTPEKINHAKQALRAFFKYSHRDDDYFLITVGDKPKLIQDFTMNANDIENSLAFPATNQSTALYDSVYLGLERVQHGQHREKMALIIISDGQDNHSRYSYQEVRKATREAGVVIYSIGVTMGVTDALESYGKAVLEELASMTGGRAFFPRWNDNPTKPDRKNRELMDIAARIATELRHQYIIGYYPDHDAFDGKCYKIKVKVNAPSSVGRIHIRAKENYCNPKPVQQKK